jgi:hypothetical protein
MNTETKPIVAATYSQYNRVVEETTISTRARRRSLLKLLGAPDGTIGSAESHGTLQASYQITEKLKSILNEENIVFENPEAYDVFIDRVSEAYCMLLRIADEYISKTDNVTNELNDGTSPHSLVYRIR